MNKKKLVVVGSVGILVLVGAIVLALAFGGTETPANLSVDSTVAVDTQPTEETVPDETMPFVQDTPDETIPAETVGEEDDKPNSTPATTPSTAPSTPITGKADVLDGTTEVDNTAEKDTKEEEEYEDVHVDTPVEVPIPSVVIQDPTSGNGDNDEGRVDTASQPNLVAPTAPEVFEAEVAEQDDYEESFEDLFA